MTIQKSHLQIALAILAVSIVYSFWSLLRPPTRAIRSAAADPASLESQIAQATLGATTNRREAGPSGGAGPWQLAIDPASIPAPPPVDTTSAPSWVRDPFLFGNETRSEPRVADTAPAPVVRSILFSATRRVADVDGRIVGIGDSIGSGRVVDITRDAVVIRTASGEQRRVALYGHPASAGSRR